VLAAALSAEDSEVEVVGTADPPAPRAVQSCACGPAFSAAADRLRSIWLESLVIEGSIRASGYKENPTQREATSDRAFYDEGLQPYRP
jgi:hypothetical protein